MTRCLLFWFLLFCGISLSATAHAAPKVVVSIKPVHALVAGVMQGVGKPALLLDGFSSPHTYQLKPDDARRLASADLVVWVGMELEGFLQKPIRQLSDRAMVITLLDEPGMVVLPSRGTDHGHETDHGHHLGMLSRDPHIWLDGQNAATIVELARDRLTSLDPSNKKIYTENATAMITAIQNQERKLRHVIDTVKHLRMIAFHDTWQYMEKRYGLNIIRHVLSDPGRLPGAKQVAVLEQLFRDRGVDCLLLEPQFRPRFLQNLIREYPVKIVHIDPLGSDIQAGPDAYVKTIRQVGRNLGQCLPH